jgi:hypothetical protein
MSGDCDRRILPGLRRKVLSLRGSVIVVDQGDQLAVAVAVGDLVLDDAHVRALVLLQRLPGPGRLDELTPGAALGLRVDRIERYEPSGSSSGADSRRPGFTRHSSAAPVPAAARQSCQLYAPSTPYASVLLLFTELK